MINYLVPSKNLINFKQLLKNDITQKNLFDQYLFFPKGRDALIYGLKKLGIDKGANIIIPAYMCSSSLEPLIAHGYNIIYQDIDNELNLDISILKNNISKHNIKAVMTVNFFGFQSNSKEISEICSLLDVVFIEDCSHSFLSHNHFFVLLKYCNFAIYSLRKSLPVQDGGVLRMNSNKVGNIRDSSKKYEMIHGNTIDKNISKLTKFTEIIFILVRSFEYLIIKFRIINLYSSKVSLVRNLFIKKEASNKSQLRKVDLIKPRIPSYLLKKYINDFDEQKLIKDTVASNYLTLTQEMTKLGFKCLNPEIPRNCIPQNVVIFDEEGGLANWLRKKKIGATKWPDEELPIKVSNSKQLFPYANLFNNKLVMIPIHQNIKEKHISRILDIMARWRRANIKNIG